jgi:hypothetical protein
VPARGIAPNILTIFVKVGLRAVRYTDNVDPFLLMNWDLDIAANPQSPLRIKQVEADPIWSRRTIQWVEMVIHAERPLFVALGLGFLSLAKPVNIVGILFDGGEIQRIWSKPNRNSEFSGSTNTAVANAPDLDIGVTPVEFEVDITGPGGKHSLTCDILLLLSSSNNLFG